MDEKISHEAIASYAQNYAEKVLKGFFSSKDQITGKEIISLCNIHQINLFVIRELFKAWKEEMNRHKSVFFDNDHPEVKEALTNYLSVLSNNILIEQIHFTPLLRKAVSQTLLIILNPYDFFSALISGKNNVLDIASFKEEIKYLKINRAPLERMLQKVEEKGQKELSGNEAFAILDQILEEVNFTPEDVDEYIAKFSAIEPLNPERFYVPKNVERPVRQESKTQERHSSRSLNDQLVTSQRPAVGDNFRKIAKIKDSLTINQKFMFTKVLFFGDFESFSKVIEEVDQLTNMQAALSYLERYSSGWDHDSKEFHEFMELVEKRFN